jgi:hypothetical protein
VRARDPLLLLGTAVLLSGCQTARNEQAGRAAATIVLEDVPAWQSRAVPADVERLERLEEAWREALADARRAGFSRQIAAEGRLLQPDVSLPRPAPTPGSYMCRVIKVGSTAPRASAFQAFRPFFCHIGVEGDLLSITKQTGSERPGGYLWEDKHSDRLIFLGSMALATEEIPRPYGEDPTRDMIGVFERIGPFRFRLTVPWPRGSSKVDIFEMTPAPVQRAE